VTPADSEVVAAASRGLYYEFIRITETQENLAIDAVRAEPRGLTLIIAVKRWAGALGEACLAYVSEKTRLYSAFADPNLKVLGTLISALCAHLGLPNEDLLYASAEWPEENRLDQFVFAAVGTSVMTGLSKDGDLQRIKSRLPWWEPSRGTFARASAGSRPEIEKIRNEWYLTEEETHKELRNLTECFQNVLLDRLFEATDEALVAAKLAFPHLSAAFEERPSNQMNVMQRRAAMVVKVREEIRLVRPLLKEDSDYPLLKEQQPDFILFEICEQDPQLKELLLGINCHHQRKALRFAKQVSAAKCNVKLNTIEKAWDLYNPDRKPRVAQTKIRPKAPGQKTHK